MGNEQQDFLNLVEGMLSELRSRGPRIQNALTAAQLESILGCDPAMLRMAASRLERQRKIRSVADQGAWIITELGFADAVPRPPVSVNVIVADKIENSQISQGSPGSHQSTSAPEQKPD